MLIYKDRLKWCTRKTYIVTNLLVMHIYSLYIYFIEKTVIRLDLRFWGIMGGLCRKNRYPPINYIINHVLLKEIWRYISNTLQNLKSKLSNLCLFDEVDLKTINMHYKKICHGICLSYAPNHTILAYERPIQLRSSLQVSYLLLKCLKMDRKHYNTNNASFDYSSFTSYRHT